MYEGDAKVARRAFDALAAEGVEAMLPFVADDFEMVTPPDLATEASTYRGHDGVRSWWSSFEEVMDDVTVLAEEIEPGGVDGQLVISFLLTARGGTTGIELEQRAFGRCTVANSKAKRLRFFQTRQEALEARP